MRELLRLQITSLLLCSVLFGASGKAPVSEYSVKAAFLYNFARFTEWPETAFLEPESPIRLCVVGEDPFGEELDFIDNKRIHGRHLEVIRVRRVEDIEKCHILFVTASMGKHVARILGLIANWSVLTVGDHEEFAQAGGVISFSNRGNHIGFDINPTAARSAGLALSSRLLSLARIVGLDPEAESGESYSNGT
jgi:hypothetical protein